MSFEDQVINYKVNLSLSNKNNNLNLDEQKIIKYYFVKTRTLRKYKNYLKNIEDIPLGSNFIVHGILSKKLSEKDKQSSWKRWTKFKRKLLQRHLWKFKYIIPNDDIWIAILPIKDIVNTIDMPDECYILIKEKTCNKIIDAIILNSEKTIFLDELKKELIIKETNNYLEYKKYIETQKKILNDKIQTLLDKDEELNKLKKKLDDLLNSI